MDYSHGSFMDSTYIKHYLDGINLLDMRLSLWVKLSQCTSMSMSLFLKCLKIILW